MEDGVIIPGLTIGLILSILFALHGITQQQVRNLQLRLLEEINRLNENSDKIERRLDEATRVAENRLKEETMKVESRLDKQVTAFVGAAIGNIETVISWLKEATKAEFSECRISILGIEAYQRDIFGKVTALETELRIFTEYAADQVRK